MMLTNVFLIWVRKRWCLSTGLLAFLRAAPWDARRHWRHAIQDPCMRGDAAGAEHLKKTSAITSKRDAPPFAWKHAIWNPARMRRSSPATSATELQCKKKAA